MDFSNSLMHCSTIAYFMAPGNERTPKQLYEDACKHRDEWKAKRAALTDRLKGMKTGENMLTKIKKWEDEVERLAPGKDDDPLSATAKSYLKKYYAYLKYGKWSASLDKGNKYTNKGKLGEPASIDLISFLDDRFYSKNEERLNNAYLTGEPDIIFFDKEGLPYLIDVKTSWDIETFMDNLGKDLNPIYWWQLQGYLALTGARSGEVSYCLVDTPETILAEEKYYLARRMNAAIDVSVDAVYLAAERELVNNMTFTDMPHAERRIKFKVERDDEAIQKIYQRVHKCREYLSEIEAMHLQGVFDAKSEKEEVAELEET